MNFFQISARIANVEILKAKRENIELFLLHKSSRTPAFFDYCKKHKLAPWVYVQLVRMGLAELLRADVLKDFSSLHQKIKMQNKARSAEAVRFLKEFEKEGIDTAILKGNYLMDTVYKDEGYKKMNDFDILVHKQDWVRIQDIYFKLGYIPLGFGWSGEKQKPAKYSHVGMSFISPNFKCIVGTQWGLKSPTAGYSLNIADAWKTAVDYNFKGVNAKHLSPEYNLLHLILHLGIYKCGTRDLMDISNLLISLKKFDENRFIAIIKKADAVEKARFALALANEISGAVPSGLLQKLKARKFGFISKRLQARIETIKNRGDIHNSYNDYFQDIEKNVIYFGLYPEFHKKMPLYLKINRMIFLPKIRTALKLADKNYKIRFSDKLKARLKAPYFVFSLLAQEIGWRFTVLLYLKLFFDLLISLKNYFQKKDSYFDYLKKLNVNPQDIKKIVQGIE